VDQAVFLKVAKLVPYGTKTEVRIKMGRRGHLLLLLLLRLKCFCIANETECRDNLDLDKPYT
jgi:hypothetical protein